MISYGKQTVDQQDIDAVVNVLRSDWLTQGPAVKTFESDLRKYFGAKYASSVSNGTAALHLTGIALGWKPGDIIITVPITFLASANSIIFSGATPDFVDIDKETYTIDPKKLEAKILKYESQGKKVKAVIAVDYAGHPCDWKSLRKIADRFDIQLINDNCHAMGASYFGDKHYAVKYADIVTQSYHPVKNFTTGEGGAVLTNNSSYAKKIDILRTHGMTKDSSLLEKNDGPWYYEMHEVGYNYRMTDFQSALGSSQLSRLDSFIGKRKKIVNKYNKSFRIKKPHIKIPNIINGVDHAHHLYPLQIDFKEAKLNKIKFFKEMKKKGLLLQVHYVPIHLQPFYRKNFGFKSGDFPISELFYQNEVSLPIYPDLSEEDQGLVIRLINKYVS